MTISEDLQDLEGDSLVTLFLLDTTPIGGGIVFRFTNNPNGPSPVVFGGQTYTAIDVQAEGFEWDGRGAFPRPVLRVSNVDGIVSSALFALGDMVGSKFTRIRTFAKHLDGGSDPDVTATFPLEIYTIDQKTKQTKAFVEWQLSSVVDQLSVQLPRRQCLRDSCTHTYRKHVSGSTFSYTDATCPYVGSTYFTKEGVSTGVAAQDVCGRKVSDCKLRFGATSPLPTRSFPGISRI